jgi:hypothetical protein
MNNFRQIGVPASAPKGALKRVAFGIAEAMP